TLFIIGVGGVFFGSFARMVVLVGCVVMVVLLGRFLHAVHHVASLHDGLSPVGLICQHELRAVLFDRRQIQRRLLVAAGRRHAKASGCQEGKKKTIHGNLGV